MYHVEVVTAYLTAIDLCHRSGRAPPDAVVETARRGLAFLDALTPPDKKLPLLNDTVLDESLSIEALRRYAARVEGFASTVERPDASDVAMADSGYYWAGGDESRMLIDGGPVGPPHLPGHSHNGLLNVLLWVDGQQIIADTGTYDYRPGPRRQYARGVAGHSTVQVGDSEPIELGRRFLMGARTAPETRFRPGDVDAFDGAYTTHRGYSHSRQVYGTSSWWLVWDRVTDATAPVRSRLTLHPAIRAELTGGTGELPLAGQAGAPAVWVYPLRTSDMTLATGSYFPKFGQEHDRDVVQLAAESPEAGFGYLISTTPRDRVGVQTRAGTPVTLTMDGATRELPNA